MHVAKLGLVQEDVSVVLHVGVRALDEPETLLGVEGLDAACELTRLLRGLGCRLVLPIQSAGGGGYQHHHHRHNIHDEDPSPCWSATSELVCGHSIAASAAAGIVGVQRRNQPQAALRVGMPFPVLRLNDAILL